MAKKTATEPKFEVVMDPRWLTHKDDEGMYCRTVVNAKCPHGFSLEVKPEAEMLVLTQDEEQKAQVISMAFAIKEGL